MTWDHTAIINAGVNDRNQTDPSFTEYQRDVNEWQPADQATRPPITMISFFVLKTEGF
ncbi:MAG: hypothetical protein RJA81_1355 [Planctomycetota bacterium]|jgi:hypothetical protein